MAGCRYAWRVLSLLQRGAGILRDKGYLPVLLVQLIGAESRPASHTEKLVSALGAFAGILSV